MARTLEDFVVQFRGDVSNLQKAVNEQNALMARAERAAETRAARLEGIFARVGKAVRSALIPAALLAAVFALRRVVAFPIAAFKEYEDALIGVGKVTGVQGVQLERLGQSMQALGTSIASIKTTQLLSITESAARLGIRGSANLRKFTAAVAGLQATTNITGEESTERLARLLNLTATDTQDIDRVSSALVALGNEFEVTETDVVDFTTKLTSGILTFRPTIQEVLALGTAFTAIGAQPESASTAITKVFQGINNSIRNSSESLDVLSETTGLTVDELRSKLGNDLFGVFVKFVEGLSEVDAAGGDVNRVLNNFVDYSVRVSKAIGPLAANVDVLRAALQVSNTSFEENVALYDEQAARLTTLTSKLEQLKNAFAETFKSKEATGFFKSIVEGLTDLFSDFSYDDILDGARAIDTFGLSLKELAGATEASESSLRKLHKLLFTGAISEEILKQSISYNTLLLENERQQVRRLSEEASALFLGAGTGGEADPVGGQKAATRLLVAQGRVEDLEETGALLNRVIKVIRNEPLEESDFGISDEERDRRIRGLQNLIAAEQEKTEVNIIQLEKMRITLRGLLDTGDLPSAGETFARFFKERANAQVDDPTLPFIDDILIRIEQLQRLNKARGEGDDAVRRTQSFIEAENILRKAETKATAEQTAALAYYIEQRMIEEETYKESKKSKIEENNAEDKLRETTARTTVELMRKISSLRESKEAFEDVTKAIEAENEILATNIDLHSQQGQQLLHQIQANQELESEIEALVDKYDLVENAITDVQDAFSDFASNSITDIENIGDAFENFANRIVNIWFDNVVRQIAGTDTGKSIFSAIGNFLVAGIGGGGGSGLYNVGFPTPDPLAIGVKGTNILGLRSGGGVRAGGIYRVGEGGPELFQPAMSGRIIPNGEGLGQNAPVVVNQTFQVTVTNEPEFDRKLARLAQSSKTYADKAVPERVRQRVNRGGSYGRDIRGGY